MSLPLRWVPQGQVLRPSSLLPWHHVYASHTTGTQWMLIDGQVDWWINRWINGWMDGYLTILSFPSLRQATCFHQSQSLLWQLLSVDTYKWPTSLRQEWKMELSRWWLGNTLVSESTWHIMLTTTTFTSRRNPTPIQHLLFSVTDLSRGWHHPPCWWAVGLCLLALHGPHGWWSSKNWVWLEWKGHRFWN